ncbi:MAG: hypothetical protein K6T59_15720 [Bryobacteraceae bacterium]|nr:hypothetical protein [Bryobacteraceae bacterium]
MNIYRLGNHDDYRGITIIDGKSQEAWEFEASLNRPQPINRPVPRVWIYDSGARPIADIHEHSWYLVMTQRAYEVLRPLLTISGEFVPFPLPDEELMLFHFTESLDALDFEKSEVKYKERWPGTEQESTGPPEVDCIPTPVFREDVIGERVLFKLTCWDWPTYCTERFRTVVQENNLVGLDFYRVYPKMTPEEDEAYLEQRFGGGPKRRARTKGTGARASPKKRKVSKRTKGTRGAKGTESRRRSKGTKRRKRGG